MNEIQSLDSRVTRLENRIKNVEKLLDTIQPLMMAQNQALAVLAKQIESTPGFIELLQKHKL